MLWEASVLLGRKKGRVRVAREDDCEVTEGREDVREVFQQRGSGAKRKLSRCRRNQIDKTSKAKNASTWDVAWLGPTSVKRYGEWFILVRQGSDLHLERCKDLGYRIGVTVLWAVTGGSELNGSNLVQETTNKIVVMEGRRSHLGETDQVSSFSSYTRRFQEVKLARIYIDEIIVRNGTLHPQADGQGERMIQTLEDIMKACVIDFGGSYQLSIRCAPFEALYGRKCRSSVLWAEVGEAVRDRQKNYVDNRRKPLEFEVGDLVLLKVSLWKGVIRLKRKCARHISCAKSEKCVADANPHVLLKAFKDGDTKISLEVLVKDG
ncbi:putative reverse transcriptase domain-containing protein, partial [Tanacetum coccineum]